MKSLKSVTDFSITYAYINTKKNLQECESSFPNLSSLSDQYLAYWVFLSNAHSIGLCHIFLLQSLSLPVSGLAMSLQPKPLTPFTVESI